MKIAFFEIENWEQVSLEKSLQNHQVTFHNFPLTSANADLAADADIVSIFIYSKIDAEVLAKLSQVKLITTRSMGFDHIDLTLTKERNILTCNVPAYGERTVAEHTFALILALSRKVMAAYDRTEKMNFDYHGLTGFDLQGKTIGIIGGGRIGINVAKIALNGFEMKALVYDASPKPELATELGFTYTTLEDLLSQSDIISIHAPYMPATHHLINQKNIGLIKKGALLINTARGGLLETQALLQALQEGRLAGAGLDVLEEECTIREESEIMSKDFSDKCNLATVLQNHLLIARNDVIITPHIAFNSKEALEKILSTTVETIQAFEKGQTINQIKPRV